MYELIKRLQDFAAGTMRDEDAKLAFDASDAIQELQHDLEQSRYYEAFWKQEAEEALKKFQVAIANKLQWIRFTTRPLTEEEKEEHPEWDCILDCKLPDDGQDILVSSGRWVTVDTFFSDDGCYLDSNGDLEGLWWMPLPEPPKEET